MFSRTSQNRVWDELSDTTQFDVTSIRSWQKSETRRRLEALVAKVSAQQITLSSMLSASRGLCFRAWRVLALDAGWLASASLRARARASQQGETPMGAQGAEKREICLADMQQRAAAWIVGMERARHPAGVVIWERQRMYIVVVTPAKQFFVQQLRQQTIWLTRRSYM